MTSRILFILEREPAMGKDGRRDDTGKPLGKRHKKSRRKNGSAGRRNSPSGRGRNRKRWDVHIPGEAAPGGNLSGRENGGAGQNMRGYRQSLRCRNAGGRNVPPASIGGRDIPAGKKRGNPAGGPEKFVVFTRAGARGRAFWRTLSIASTFHGVCRGGGPSLHRHRQSAGGHTGQDALPGTRLKRLFRRTRRRTR